ncbi:MAG: hypothetical protein LKK08_06170 [Bacteroidales bacterium]|jgi:hypothetical protein|nr:hypothetical protein [Bacteroidales bacterium]
MGKNRICPDVFDKRLEEWIKDKIICTPSAPKGMRYKRTPYDSLRENGNLNVPFIKSEFDKIGKHESKLPRNQRDAIVLLVLKVVADINKETKTKDNGQ